MAGLTFYVVCFFLLSAGLIAFLLYWVIPRFMRIFQEFHTSVPAPTRLMLTLVDAAGAHWYLFLGAFLGLIAWGLFVVIRRGGWAGVNTGLASFVYPRLETPGVLRSLAQTVACHQPLSYGIESLEVHHPHRGIRRRLRRLREQIVRGHHSFQPLADAGLLSGREADALTCAERAGNLSWVLDAIADNIDRRHRTFLESVVETVQPAVITGIGLLVFVICIGIFYPIVHLIQVKL